MLANFCRYDYASNIIHLMRKYIDMTSDQGSMHIILEAIELLEDLSDIEMTFIESIDAVWVPKRRANGRSALIPKASTLVAQFHENLDKIKAERDACQEHISILEKERLELRESENDTKSQLKKMNYIIEKLEKIEARVTGKDMKYNMPNNNNKIGKTS